MYYTILYYAILYYTILYNTMFYSTMLYYTMLYSTLLYSSILYYTGRTGHECGRIFGEVRGVRSSVSPGTRLIPGLPRPVSPAARGRNSG